MDLSTIEEKLDKGEYKKLEQFQDDMQLMFDNCDEYNGPDSSKFLFYLLYCWMRL